MLLAAARYGYAARFGSASGMPEADAIVKYDLQAGNSRTHLHGKGRYSGEAVFTPRDGATAEDDGWIGFYVFDNNTGSSEFVLVASHDFEAAPVGRVILPQRVPFRFHGAWISGEQMATQRRSGARCRVFARPQSPVG
ncbi:MAG: carotenoid oxygenase family protein [Anaerolineaceae bacterium]